MGFKLDREKSLLGGEPLYNKAITECEIKSPRVRVGSRRTKSLKITDCDEVLRPAVYID
jgi:hypothetical protein